MLTEANKQKNKTKKLNRWTQVVMVLCCCWWSWCNDFMCVKHIGLHIGWNIPTILGPSLEAFPKGEGVRGHRVRLQPWVGVWVGVRRVSVLWSLFWVLGSKNASVTIAPAPSHISLTKLFSSNLLQCFHGS